MKLQTLVSREKNPLEPAVVTVGSFHAGAKHNIISDEAKLQLTVRSYSDESRKQLLDGISRIARGEAIAAGWDLQAPEPERQFFYMPFEHSENPADQSMAVRLLTERMGSDPEMALHARAHQAVIARFGRFPGRNAALGRTSTSQELAYIEGDAGKW